VGDLGALRRAQHRSACALRAAAIMPLLAEVLQCLGLIFLPRYHCRKWEISGESCALDMECLYAYGDIALQHDGTIFAAGGIALPAACGMKST